MRSITANFVGIPQSQSPLPVPERQRNSQRPWILPGTVARLAVESRPVMDRIELEPFGLLGPGFANVFERREAIEGL